MEKLTFGCNVTGIKHLHYSDRLVLIRTRRDPVLEVLSWELTSKSQSQCAPALHSFSNASLEGDSDWTSGVFVTFSIHPSRSDFDTDLGNVQCHRAYDKLVIPNFALAGSVLSRNHSLATFVHERLEWALVDQSPEKSETKWSCVDAAGYNIITVYTPPPPWLTPTAIPTLPVCMLANSTANMSTGATAQHLTVRARPPGK